MHNIVSFAVVVLATAITAVPTQALAVGEYFRPATDVSGIPGTNATYRRSPCPALNTLANHGHLPRDGQNVTTAVLYNALTSVYNLGPVTAQLLVNQVPSTFSLDYLGTHDLLEHDASLAHSDHYFGGDPMVANASLAEDMFARANSDGLLDVNAIANTRADRAATCQTSNPDCTFGLQESKTAYLEASVLLLVLGDGSTISVDHARSFILDERFPDDWTKPALPVTVVQVVPTTGALVGLSLV